MEGYSSLITKIFLCRFSPVTERTARSLRPPDNSFCPNAWNSFLSTSIVSSNATPWRVPRSYLPVNDFTKHLSFTSIAHLNAFLYFFFSSGGQEISVDDRSWLMLTLMSMSVDSSVPFFYPSVYPVHDLLSLPEDQVAPVAVRWVDKLLLFYGHSSVVRVL